MSIWFYQLLIPIFNSNEIIITYGLHPFDICEKNPELWLLIKKTYILSFIFSNISISNFLYIRILFPFYIYSKKIFNKLLNSNNNEKKYIFHTNKDLRLLVGLNSKTNKAVYISENGLYQNILITGGIGSRKNFKCYVSYNQAVN